MQTKNDALTVTIIVTEKLKVDGKPVGECLHPSKDTRTDGRTTRKHNASGTIYWMGGDFAVNGRTTSVCVLLWILLFFCTSTSTKFDAGIT